MTAYIVLVINKKEIRLTLTEVLELREQLNALTGLGTTPQQTIDPYSYTLTNIKLTDDKIKD